MSSGAADLDQVSNLDVEDPCIVGVYVDEGAVFFLQQGWYLMELGVGKCVAARSADVDQWVALILHGEADGIAQAPIGKAMDKGPL